MTKRDELICIVSEFTGFDSIKERLANEILTWHEKELDPLRKVRNELMNSVINDGEDAREVINKLWQAIKTVLGE